MSQITVKNYVKPLQSYVILFGLKITAFGSDKSVRTTIVIYDIQKTQSDGENIYTYYTFNKMNKLYLKNIILKSFFLSFFGCHVMNLMPPDLTWTENLLLYWMLWPLAYNSQKIQHFFIILCFSFQFTTTITTTSSVDSYNGSELRLPR